MSEWLYHASKIDIFLSKSRVRFCLRVNWTIGNLRCSGESNNNCHHRITIVFPLTGMPDTHMADIPTLSPYYHSIFPSAMTKFANLVPNFVNLIVTLGVIISNILLS